MARDHGGSAVGVRGDAGQQHGGWWRQLTPRTTRKALVKAAVWLVLSFVVLTAIWAGAGLLLTGPLGNSGLVRADESIATGLVDSRTPTLNTLTHIGGLLSATLTKAIVTAIVAIGMLLAWKSWREPFLISMALILEASAFITATAIVGRPRPDVPALDDVGVTTSFPSGHAAAAAAYSAIAVVIFERTRVTWIRAVTVLLAVAVPLIVSVSRMYRGVHYLTDVIAGMLLGVVCVVAVWVIVKRCFDDEPVPR